MHFFVILMDFVLVRVRRNIEDFLFFTVQFNFCRTLLPINKKLYSTVVMQIMLSNIVIFTWYEEVKNVHAKRRDNFHCWNI